MYALRARYILQSIYSLFGLGENFLSGSASERRRALEFPKDDVDDLCVRPTGQGRLRTRAEELLSQDSLGILGCYQSDGMSKQ